MKAKFCSVESARSAVGSRSRSSALRRPTADPGAGSPSCRVLEFCSAASRELGCAALDRGAHRISFSDRSEAHCGPPQGGTERRQIDPTLREWSAGSSSASAVGSRDSLVPTWNARDPANGHPDCVWRRVSLGALWTCFTRSVSLGGPRPSWRVPGIPGAGPWIAELEAPAACR